MQVGDLRRALEGVPDALEVVVVDDGDPRFIYGTELGQGGDPRDNSDEFWIVLDD